MAGLQEVVRGLAARDGVDAVVVVSGDGLPIDQVSRNGLDADAVAALAASLAQGARRLGNAVDCTQLTTGVLEFDKHLVIFAPLGSDNLLFILVNPGTNIGPLLYDLRRHGSSIAELL